MPEFRFIQLDVFTDRAFTGNPLAVFPEAEGLTDEQMMQIAREMNLSRLFLSLRLRPQKKFIQQPQMRLVRSHQFYDDYESLRRRVRYHSPVIRSSAHGMDWLVRESFLFRKAVRVGNAFITKSESVSFQLILNLERVNPFRS